MYVGAVKILWLPVDRHKGALIGRMKAMIWYVGVPAGRVGADGASTNSGEYLTSDINHFLNAITRAVLRHAPNTLGSSGRSRYRLNRLVTNVAALCAYDRRKLWLLTLKRILKTAASCDDGYTSSAASTPVLEYSVTIWVPDTFDFQLPFPLPIVVPDHFPFVWSR